MPSAKQSSKSLTKTPTNKEYRKKSQIMKSTYSNYQQVQ